MENPVSKNSRTQEVSQVLVKPTGIWESKKGANFFKVVNQEVINPSNKKG